MEQTLATLLQECDNLKSRLSELRPLPTEALKKRLHFGFPTIGDSRGSSHPDCCPFAWWISKDTSIHRWKRPNFPTSNESVSFEKGYTLVSLKGSNDEKIAYYKALEASHIEKQPEIFQAFVAEAERNSLKRYLSVLGADENQ